MFILRGLIILSLGVIFFQDIKSRAVYWFLFPLLALLFLSEQVLQRIPITVIANNWVYNMLFLLPQFLLLTFYFCLKERRWVNITDSLLGWGDVLLLVSLGFYFSLTAFIFFYLSSLVLIIFFWSIWLAVSRSKEQCIPLAGIQALLLLLLMITTWVLPNIDFWYNTAKLLKFKP